MMKLLEIERQSALWLKITGGLEERLTTLHLQNEANLDPVETAKIRGRIAEIKLMLEWAESDPQID